MNYLAIHKQLPNDMHSIKVNKFNTTAIWQVMDISTQLATQDQEHYFLLIDVTDVRLLPLRMFAYDLKQIFYRSESPDFLIAIVINNKAYAENVVEIIKTIINRGSMEIFTDMDKAKLWLQLEKQRLQA